VTKNPLARESWEEMRDRGRDLGVGGWGGGEITAPSTHPAPSPSGHPLLSGPPTFDIHQIFTPKRKNMVTGTRRRKGSTLY
jgi:hypothetical protein